MREIHVSQIKEAIKSLFLEAACHIGPDVIQRIKSGLEIEQSPIGRDTLSQILENNSIAALEKIPVCQDTGMAVVFAQIGQELHITGGGFEEAVNEGVKSAYLDGYMRMSVVDDPLFDRKNTKDNTPAVIYSKLVTGDKITLTAVPKGFGSENCSALKMLKPAEGVGGVIEFVVETVLRAGPNCCPPSVVGVGIGGTAEKALLLAKWAIARPLDIPNSDPRYAQLEREILNRINMLGIGPAGTGGSVTCLAVNIEHFPTHIAGLPVAVNICCHAARHCSVTL